MINASLLGLPISFKGLSQFEIENILALAVNEDNGDLTKGSLAFIFEQKRQMIMKSGILDMIPRKETIEDIGGLDNLKAKNIPELKGKRVYVDMNNYNLEMSTIECNTKSSEGGYIRSGLAYRIPEDIKRIRFFVYWNDSSRVDVDLHAKLVANSGTISNIGWDADYKNEISAFCVFSY